MTIPRNVPGLRKATILLGVLFAVWIVFEGALWRATAMGIFVAVVLSGYLLQRLLGGRKVPFGRWLIATSSLGLVTAVNCALFTLLFMALKTGLHSHGPEFTLDDSYWILAQLTKWLLAGPFAGLGVGLIAWRGD